MNFQKKMETGKTYHLFNHANGSEDIFFEEQDYHFFMSGIFKRLCPIIELHAWCLMPNHFHLALSLPEKDELANRDKRFSNLTEEQACRKISKQCSNFLSSYTLSLNKKYARIGSLFRPNLKWKLVDDDNSFCKLIHYIHANPVHHGFVREMKDWPYSSYSRYISMPFRLQKGDMVIQSFGGFEAFQTYHSQPINIKHKDLSSERILLDLVDKKKKKMQILK